jgi:uncharacterized protein YndB with AHSA1/START domain
MTSQVDDKYGVLEPAGTRWRLRFTRHLKHPPDKVWRALTEPEHLQAWFPQKIVGQWAVGATLKFVSDNGDFEGQLLAYEPLAVVEFLWGTDTIRFEVVPDGNGSRLTLLATFDELGKAARDAAGWHACLDLFEQELDGTKPSWTVGERWQTVNKTYVERLGPEASTIGPPEGAQAR